jgi:hypothetical protein
MVPKQPPPSFLAPYPAIKPLKILFIIIVFLLGVIYKKESRRALSSSGFFLKFY